jgi:phosphatidylinositol alpha-1,6-mannosyltransferase
MKTLLLAPELFATDSGVARILRLYLKALCELSAPADRVRFIVLNDTVADSQDLRRYSDQHLDQWQVCNGHKGRFVRASLRQALSCDRIVCGHVAQLPVAWAARCLKPRLRYYLIAHGIEVWRSFSFAERLALRGAHRIFCVSEHTRRTMLEHIALDPSRVVVLSNALDPFFEISAGEPLSACAPVILTVTRLSNSDRYKGVDHLISAMPAVRAAVPGATLRIVGRGDDLPRLQALAQKIGVLQAGVEFLGFVSDKDLDAELRTCRLFALPSQREGFGLVFLEAMAHGRPCLGANAGGIPEVVTVDSGVLPPFGDVPAIAAAAVGALQRDWPQPAILDRARHFSYSLFKERLASLLAQ